jgi:hypothetical protein
MYFMGYSKNRHTIFTALFFTIVFLVNIFSFFAFHIACARDYKIEKIPIIIEEKDCFFTEIMFHEKMLYLMENKGPVLYIIPFDHFISIVRKKGSFLINKSDNTKKIQTISYQNRDFDVEVPVKIAFWGKSIHILDRYDGRIVKYDFLPVSEREKNNLKLKKNTIVNDFSGLPYFSKRDTQDFSIDSIGRYYLIDKTLKNLVRIECYEKVKRVDTKFSDKTLKNNYFFRPRIVCSSPKGFTIVYDSEKGIFFYDPKGNFIRSETWHKKRVINKIRLYKGLFLLIDIKNQEILLYDVSGNKKEDTLVGRVNRLNSISDITDVFYIPSGLGVLDTLQKAVTFIHYGDIGLYDGTGSISLDASEKSLKNESAISEVNDSAIISQAGEKNVITIHIDEQREFGQVIRVKLRVKKNNDFLNMDNMKFNIMVGNDIIKRFDFHSFGESAILSFRKPDNIKRSFPVKILVKIGGIIRKHTFFIKN